MLNLLSQKRILIIEVFCFLILGIVIEILLPEESLLLFIGFATTYIVICNLYNHSSYYSKLGYSVLLGVAMIMAFFITLNIWQFTSLSAGTIDNPVLNNYDSAQYFNNAKYSYSNNAIIDSTTIGYPFLIGNIWKFTGITIVVPLLINYIFTLLSIIISGILGARLIKPYFPEYKANEICSITMLLIASCCYYIGNGNVILKEPSIYLGVALCGYALVGLYRNDSISIKTDGIDVGAFLVGTTLIAFNRVGLSILLILAIFMLASYRSKRNIYKAIAMLLIVFSLWGCVSILSPRATEVQKAIVTQKDMSDGYYDNEKSHELYHKLIPDYFNYPVWKKIIYLPFTASVQYFIPFPWNFGKYSNYGFSQIYSQISYPWYIIGGIILFFFLMRWRREDLNGLQRWGLLCIFCYLMPAFLFAGMVSRYWLPFLPLILPLATFVILEIKRKDYRRRFTYWVSGYSFIVMVTLVSCYFLQHKL